MPNTSLLTVAHSVDLAAPAVAVWEVIGRFDRLWHPLVATIKTTGSGVGQLRQIATIDGKSIIERLEESDGTLRKLRYSLVSGIPASRYTGTLEVLPKGTGSTVSWRVDYRPDGQAELFIHALVDGLLSTGMESLKTRFGVSQ